MSLPPRVRSVAIAWLLKDDWPTWLSIDANFQPDYEHWLAHMEALFEKVQATGHRVEKIIVEPAEFLAWSRVNGGEVDSKSRAAFAAYKLQRRHTDH